MRVLAAALLALALLGAQALARVHALEHPAEPATGQARAHDADWGHEPGSGACLLLDELVSSQAPGAAAPDVSAPAPGRAAHEVSRSSLPAAAPPRVYLARAPPAP